MRKIFVFVLIAVALLPSATSRAQRGQSTVFLPFATNDDGDPDNCVAKAGGSIFHYKSMFDMDCYLVWGTGGMSDASITEKRVGIWKARYLTCDGAYYIWKGQMGRFDYWDYLKKVPEDYGGLLFTYNEPDLPPPQCFNYPRTVAWGFRLLSLHRPDAQLVCPTVSHKDYDNGWKWMVEFMRYYRLDFGEWPPCAGAAIHWYNPHVSPESMLLSYKQMLGRFGMRDLPLYITEYGSSDHEAMCKMVTAFESDPQIKAHFYWSGAGDGISLLEDGEITGTGRAYLECMKSLK